MGAVRAAVDGRWTQALDEVFRDLTEPKTVFQPVVDLMRGAVVGYEALSRFTGPPLQPPDRWFAAAAEMGRGAELQARALASALLARASLPADTFLSVNVDPNLLASRPIQLVLQEAGYLGGVVLELTEHTAVSDYTDLASSVERVRAAGALIAVDDAGAGYASLSHIVALRPDFVKLDRSLVADLDRDEVKRALVELLGAFAGRVNAWLLAEGIEREGEMEAVLGLGVPLGQGYLLGRPGPAWVKVDTALAWRIAARARAATARLRVAGVVERLPCVYDEDTAAAEAAFAADPGLDVVAVADRWERPIGWLDRAGVLHRSPQVVKPGSEVSAVARRAMTRSGSQRFDPLPVSDDRGHYTGMVRVERLVERLSDPPGD